MPRRYKFMQCLIVNHEFVILWPWIGCFKTNFLSPLIRNWWICDYERDSIFERSSMEHGILIIRLILYEKVDWTFTTSNSFNIPEEVWNVWNVRRALSLRFYWTLAHQTGWILIDGSKFFLPPWSRTDYQDNKKTNNKRNGKIVRNSTHQLSLNTRTYGYRGLIWAAILRAAPDRPRGNDTRNPDFWQWLIGHTVKPGGEIHLPEIPCIEPPADILLSMPLQGSNSLTVIF